MKKTGIILAAVASAFLFALGLPNEIFHYGFPILGYVALIPLYCAMAAAPSYGFAALTMALYGALQHALSSYWLFFFHDYAVWTLGGTSVAYFIIYFVAGLYLGYFQKKSAAWRPLTFALFWTCLEYLKSTGFLGYPWGLLPYTQTRFLPLLQIADATGIYGISFLLAFINASLAEFCLSWPEMNRGARSLKHDATVRQLEAGAALFLVFLAYGTLRLVAPPRERGEIQAVLVQQNSDSWTSNEAGSIAGNMKLARAALAKAAQEGRKADIILFSESSLNRPYKDFSRWFNENPRGDAFTPFIRSTGAYLLTGSPQILDYENIKMTNSVVLIAPDGREIDDYAKQHPVPFAESIPFWDIPQFRAFMQNVVGVSMTFVMGTRYTIFELPAASGVYKFGAPICFEDAFPGVCRGFVQRGADLLINLTNDSWSKTDSSEIQHFAAARFRAIEFRMPLVRSTNGGVSCVVGPTGRVLDTMPLFTSDAKMMRVPVNEHVDTFYLVCGDLFAWCCLAAFAAWFACFAWSDRAADRRDKKEQAR